MSKFSFTFCAAQARLKSHALASISSKTWYGPVLNRYNKFHGLHTVMIPIPDFIIFYNGVQSKILYMFLHCSINIHTATFHNLVETLKLKKA